MLQEHKASQTKDAAYYKKEVQSSIGLQTKL